MRCSEYQVLISAYVDGVLSPQEEKVLFEHLAQCSECQTIYDAIMVIRDGCGQMEQVPLPENFHQNLMTKIQPKQNKVSHRLIKRHLKWQYSSGLVATLFLGGVLGYQLYHLQSQDETQSVEEGYKLARSTDEAYARVVSGGNIEIIEIEVVVKDQSNFEVELENFLIKQKINYEKTTEGYTLKLADDYEGLIEWLNGHSKAVYLKDESIQLLDSDTIEIKLCVSS